VRSPRLAWKLVAVHDCRDLIDGSGRLLENARVTVESDMPHAGMSPVFGECKEVENGRCQARIG